MSKPATEAEVLEPKPKAMPKPELKAGQRIEPIIPRSIEEAFRLAQAVIAAGICPDSYCDEHKRPDPQKVLIGILKSMEVGLAPITGLSTIAIINNRPCIWGDGAAALVQKAGVVDKFELEEIGVRPKETAEVQGFGDEYGFEARIYRKGQAEPYSGRFTVGDAKRARLWLNPKRQPWMLYPKRMLRNRAVAFALRDGFADCLAGLSIREEVEDIPAAPVKTDVSFLADDAPAKAIEHKPEPAVTDALADGIKEALLAKAK